uniref:Tetratricopeptide repeat protein n=1 Tax=Streptomyces sp. NBC_01393 TaxID=2903851 RepID=A0AAU3I2I4_9ACTN
MAKWYALATVSAVSVLLAMAFAVWACGERSTHNSEYWATFAVAISVILLILFFGLLRRAMLERNAYVPGSIDVQELVDATKPETKPLIQDLTSQFRKQISETDLYPPTVLPAEAPPEHFLDLLGDVDLEPKKLLTSLLRLFSRLRPKVAYRVCGVLRVRTQEPHFGMTVTITSFIRGCRSTEVWGATWEQVVRRAGYWVMASILPVTRRGKEPPWAGWWGKRMPTELFALYQEAKELSSERKFDEALERLYAALRLDPMNLYLRVEIAGIQENTGLYLDALETYHAALTIDGQNTEERNRQLWTAPWSFGRRFRQRRCLRHPGVLNTRYRYAVVLGTSEHTAAQWCNSGMKYPRRLKDHENIVHLLAPVFAERYWPIVSAIHPSKSKFEARQWLTEELERSEPPWVRLIFQLACAQELYRLAQDRPLRFPWRHIAHNPTGLQPTKSVLHILANYWAPLRLAWVSKELNREVGTYLLNSGHRVLTSNRPRHSQSSRAPLKRVIEYDAYVDWSRVAMEWPGEIGDINRLTNKIDHAMCRQKRYDWQAHYGAACVYAIAMNGESSGSIIRCRCRDLAVRELEESVRCTESGFVTVKRSWLLASDVDLDELRLEESFISFEREAFPHFTPDRSRPASHEQFQTETKMYDRQLLASTAQMMERTWHRRGVESTTDVHTVAYWFRDEVGIWQAIVSFAETHGRNWPDRAKLLRRVREVADPRILDEEGFSPRLREWDSVIEEIWFGTAREQETSGCAEKVDEALQVLLPEIEEGAESSPTARSRQWLAEARKAVSHGQNSLDASLIREVCAGYAAVWQGLYDLLDATGELCSFRQALLNIRVPR